MRSAIGTPDLADAMAESALILGTPAADSLEGGTGNDTILGFGGGDTIYGDGLTGPVPPSNPDRPDVILPGDNLILGDGGADVIVAGWGADTVFGGAGDDSITGFGGGISGGNAFDFVLVREGPNLLSGDAGDDTLLGGGRNDTLLGGPGDDVFDGNYGADWLIGGAGADRFFYSPRNPFLIAPDTGIGEGNRDVILDFEEGRDVIDLSGYARTSGGQLRSALFLGSDAFEESAALQIRAEVEGDHTLVQFYSPGFLRSVDTPTLPAGPTGEILLAGIQHLTAANFLATGDFLI